MIPHKAFYFIRHGETEWNKLGLYMGSQDIPLNITGIEQAKEAALLLRKEPIDYIVSSSLIRAKQTAEIIAETIKKPITIVDDLKERYLGIKEGMQVDKEVLIEHLVTSTYGDEEEADIFQNRVISAMNNILTDTTRNALIVSHGGVYSTLCQAMKWPIIELQNCAPVHHTPPVTNKYSWLIYDLKNPQHD